MVMANTSKTLAFLQFPKRVFLAFTLLLCCSYFAAYDSIVQVLAGSDTANFLVSFLTEFISYPVNKGIHIRV
jgi:hypothetical protein